MAADHEADEPFDGADWLFLTRDGMPDGGPRYTETPADPYSPTTPAIAEPWNTATAALFVLVAGLWVWRLRGRYARYPFLCTCLPILLTGGIGGTLYHARRTSPVFFVLDIAPIMLLGAAGAGYVLVRLGRSGGWRRAAAYAAGAVGFYVFVNGALYPGLQHTPLGANPHLRVSLSYLGLAGVILLPLGVLLARTRFRHGGWVAAGLVAFVLALFFRLVDRGIGAHLPMGSHWLWHAFGAATTAFVVEYFYRLEGEAGDRRSA